MFQKHSNFKNPRNTISKRKQINYNKIGELQTFAAKPIVGRRLSLFYYNEYFRFCEDKSEKNKVYDCKELRCYFFSSKFCIGFFPCFRKIQISKTTGMPFPEKNYDWNINFKNGQIWVIIGMVEKTENFRRHSNKL